MEYLQYYIHEMRLADPVWVAHLNRVHTSKEGEPVEKDEDVGPAQYPEGEEWIRLPNTFLRRADFVTVVGHHCQVFI